MEEKEQPIVPQQVPVSNSANIQPPPQQYQQNFVPQQNYQNQQPFAMRQTYVFGSHPQPIQCQVCFANVVTEVAGQPGLATWLVAGGTFFIGCCCLAPFAFLSDSLKDKEHYCSNCGSLIGIKKML
jgi:hypothetical protein